MIVGFTGTSEGMARLQNEVFTQIISSMSPTEFHHGDCVGADAQAHDKLIQVSPKTRIVIHPPLNPKSRAFCQGDSAWEKKEYLDRNKDIVNCCALLIATPLQMTETIRSGTWSTVRFARKTGKVVIIIFPDGSVNEDSNK